MKALLVSAAAMIASAFPALAGGMAEPIMEAEVVAEKASSSAGILVPLLLLILVAAAVSGGGGGDRGRINPENF